MVIRNYADVKVNIKTEDILKENIIYKLTFPNGKIYIGQTKNKLKSRISTHCNDSFRIKSTSYDLIKSRAIRKYMTFSVDVLYQGDDLDKQEIYYIEKYNATDSKFGYNSCQGAIGGLTHDNRVKVDQYDLQGNYIQSFKSYSDAAKYIRPNSAGATGLICRCAKNDMKNIAYGFIWKKSNNNN